MRIKEEQIFYLIGKVILLPAMIIGIWFAVYGFNQFGTVFQCDIREHFGFPCPGCGGTHAVYYLCRGDFVNSFFSHPVVLYGVAAYIHFMIRCFYRKHFAPKVVKPIYLEHYIYFAIVIILVQWFVKLYIYFMNF